MSDYELDNVMDYSPEEQAYDAYCEWAEELEETEYELETFL